MSDPLRLAIEQALGREEPGQWRHAGTTGPTDAWSLATGGARYFVKIAAGRHADTVACEADGLRAIAATHTIRVPSLAAAALHEQSGWLAVEWLEIAGPPSACLGNALARLHRAQAPRGPNGERFGWHRDNWIGATPQANTWSDDWCTFFRERRLAPQLALAAANGHAGALQRDGERVLAALPALLRGHDVAPSLVHGDLWAGNAATLADGDGAVFDPAVHVGDREVDVAMTELFGGFGEDFLAAYRNAWPLDAGYPLRRELYNLYHLLNHVNLFGAAYVARTQRTLAALLAAIGR
ncbi:MAG TPA: fructosamine kinase family protein [Casimicrobiaceae bacterium]|nr:fructosamine kinase family protein [Casimicrobiaceae bacterium]